MSVATNQDPVSRAREIQSVLRLNAAAGEEARAITDEAHEALVNAGVFTLMRPASLGGQEADLLTFIRVVREVSRGDGAAGWCAMISGCYASFGALLPRAGAEEVFADETTVIAGALAPGGQAVKVPGGYRVTGRWTFGSNSPHAKWIVGGAVIIEDGAPIMQPNGIPQLTLVVVPKSDVTIIDTWTSTGLRGTGSHDYAMQDLFVPADRTFWFSDEPHEAGPLYALPAVASYGAGIGAVPVGIAEHALEAFAQLAPEKKPILSQLSLQEKTNVQDRVGVALASVEAANAYLERVVSDAWSVVAGGVRLSWEQRGKLWLGPTHAAQMSVQAIDQLYMVAGASSVFAANDFDRCLRDARTASQHIMTQFLNYEVAGKQFLGLDVRDSTWAFDARPADFA